MVLVLTGLSLVLQKWDDLYIVYQPSSSETHVFNETTVLILKSLEQGPLAMVAVKERTEAVLGVGHGELGIEDFAFATHRLEELGLIDCLDETVATQ